MLRVGRKWGVVVDFWREHRRLRLQLDHDKAMTTDKSRK